MKVLVNSQSGKIQGAYDSPLKFSVSGKYVINMPPEVGLIPINSDDPSLLITAKQNALMALHPTLSEAFNNELLNISMIDQTQSFGVVAAPNKGTLIMPGGIIMTTTMTLTVPILSRIAVIYSGFLLNRDVKQVSEQPDPASLLYGWDLDSSSFVEFGPGVFEVDVMDSTGTTVLVPNLQSGLEYIYLDTTPLDVRLRFTSLSLVPWHLSDYLLLVG